MKCPFGLEFVYLVIQAASQGFWNLLVIRHMSLLLTFSARVIVQIHPYHSSLPKSPFCFERLTPTISAWSRGFQPSGQ